MNSSLYVSGDNETVAGQVEFPAPSTDDQTIRMRKSEYYMQTKASAASREKHKQAAAMESESRSSHEIGFESRLITQVEDNKQEVTKE